MRAVDLVVQETFVVLPKVQVDEPIGNIVLAPVREGLGGKGPGRWGQGEWRVGRGGATRQEVSGRERAGDQEWVGGGRWVWGEQWRGAGEVWVRQGHGVSRWGERGLEFKRGVVHGAGEERQGGGPGGSRLGPVRAGDERAGGPAARGVADVRLRSSQLPGGVELELQRFAAVLGAMLWGRGIGRVGWRQRGVGARERGRR